MSRYFVLVAVATMLPALSAPTTHAQEPTLEVSSAHATCDEPLTFRGTGDEPGVAFSLGIPGMTDMRLLATVQADPDAPNALFVTYDRVDPSDPPISARVSLPSGVQRSPPVPAGTGHGFARSSGRGPTLGVLAGLLALALPLVRVPRGSA